MADAPCCVDEQLGAAAITLTQLDLFASSARSGAAEMRRPSRAPRPRPDGRGRHANSLDAHSSMERVLVGRRAEIVAWLRNHGPATDREIVTGLYYQGADMDLVRPRVTELLDAGVLIEAGNIRDPVTDRIVRRTSLSGS